MKTIVSLALVVLPVLLLALAVPQAACAAAAEEGSPPSGFCDFLRQGWNEAGIGAALAAAVAIIIEFVPGFQAWPARKKQLVYLAICLGIGFGSWGIATAAGCVELPDWWSVLVAAWQAFRNGIVAFGAGTVFHAIQSALIPIKPAPAKA